MKSYLNIRVFILFCIIFLTNRLIAQEHNFLVNSHVAIFYPDKFNRKSQYPSFVLQQEPKVGRQIPSTWRTKVLFNEAFGKRNAYVKIEEGTDLYGTGETTGALVRNGKTVRLWNTDNFIYEKDHGLRLYQSHPWVLGVRKDGSAFGVLADNTWKQEINIGEGIQFSSEGPAFRVVVIEDETPQKVIQRLSELTGKMALPPLWSLGFQQCRWSYYPESRVAEVADTFRLKKIPCDVIWMDIHYMDEYRIFTFSPQRFPNPKKLNDYLHQKGFKSVWMVDPGVKVDSSFSVFKSGEYQDVWTKTANGKNFVGKVWPGDCVFPDFTQDKTAKWWGNLYKDFMANGVDGIWNDMNEPAVFNGVDATMPVDNIHLGGGAIPKDVHLRYHNIYGMLMAKASMEGMLKANSDKRPFLLTRSNFMGGQKYAATWTGDNASTWEHLKMSIPMGLNLGLSGQPFNGSDIGGFAGNATPDLFAHWIALGAFYPFSRAHKVDGSRNHEPWALGDTVEKVSRIAIERRYRLLPYIYTLFHEASETGISVMQPVFFADCKDLDLRSEDQAFLLGSDLLVIPKWAVNPMLPKGNWRTISLVGEDSKNDSYQPDVRIRPGAIVPLGNIIQNTTEYSLDTLTLIISLDSNRKAKGKLYNDAGDGFEYTKGGFSIIEFKAEEVDGYIVVESIITGKYPVKNSMLNVCIITDDGVIQASGELSKILKIKCSERKELDFK